MITLPENNEQQKYNDQDTQLQERVWLDKTISKFDDVLRTNYDKGIEEFADIFIQSLSDITNAFRGVTYFYEKETNTIVAKASFAYRLDKMPQRAFALQEGIIGQVFANKKTLYYENLPADSINIRSASIKINAASMLVVPLVFNDKAFGVVELIFIHEIEKKYIELVEKIARNTAAILESLFNNELTKQLLAQAQVQTEALLAQEEEMRQNMEELNATQEQLQQKVQEIEKVRKELIARENVLNKFALITETDLQGNITYANDLACATAQYAKEQLIGKPQSILRHPDTPKEIFKELWSTIKNNTMYQGKFKNRKKDGTSYWIDITISPIVDEKGQITKYLGIGFDITNETNREQEMQTILNDLNQKQQQLLASEEELKQNLEELQATQDAMQQKNAILEAQNRKMEANNKVLEKIMEQHRTKEEKLNKKIEELENALWKQQNIQ